MVIVSAARSSGFAFAFLAAAAHTVHQLGFTGG
jgi:hypothetical protein